MDEISIKISVIIPMYNPSVVALDNALSSVAKQSFDEPFEVILINDGSNETIYTKIKDLISKYDSLLINLINQTNSGVSDARNRGIDNARGKYISFIDSDDYIAPEFLMTAYDIAEKCDADVVYGDIQRTSVLNSIYEPSGKQEVLLKGTDIDYAKLSMLGTSTNQFDYCVSGSPCGCLYKRKLLNNIRFDPKIRYFEDQVFNRQVLNKAEIVAVVPEKWYFYYTNPDSAMHASRIDNEVQNKIFNLLDAFAELNRNESESVLDAYKRYLLHMYIAFLSLVYKKTGCSKEDTKNIILNVLKRSEYVAIAQNRVPNMSIKERIYYTLIHGRIIKPMITIMKLTKKI